MLAKKFIIIWKKRILELMINSATLILLIAMIWLRGNGYLKESERYGYNKEKYFYIIAKYHQLTQFMSLHNLTF